MLYINDPTQPHYKYDDVVQRAINTGINYKRAYLYLASLGIKGAFTRIMSNDNMHYQAPVKVAVINDKIVKSVDVCNHCNNLVIK